MLACLLASAFTIRTEVHNVQGTFLFNMTITVVSRDFSIH